jgi:hypothetical protein
VRQVLRVQHQVVTRRQALLRDNPALLRSAYLLRGSQDEPPDQPGAVTPATGRTP